MADEHRHAAAIGRDLDGGVEDFLRLHHHLPFFLGLAVIHEGIDLRYDVEGDFLVELFRLQLGVHIDVLRLVEQFVHARLARARH